MAEALGGGGYTETIGWLCVWPLGQTEVGEGNVHETRCQALTRESGRPRRWRRRPLSLARGRPLLDVAVVQQRLLVHQFPQPIRLDLAMGRKLIITHPKYKVRNLRVYFFYK